MKKLFYKVFELETERKAFWITLGIFLTVAMVWISCVVSGSAAAVFGFLGVALGITAVVGMLFFFVWIIVLLCLQDF